MAKAKRVPARKAAARKPVKTAAPKKAATPTKAAPKTAAPNQAPTKAAPTKAAPTKAAPTKAASTKAAKAASTTAAPTKAAPTKAAPEKAPRKAAPRKAAPKKVAPRKLVGERAPLKVAAKKAGRKKGPKKAVPKQVASEKALPSLVIPESSGAVPVAIAPEGSGRTASGAVVRMLEADAPIAALRDFLDAIDGPLTIQQGHVALGSAQLMLLPIAHEHRGGPEVKALLDLVLARWGVIPDRTGFHAQEFLRNALAAVGDDRDRVIQLAMLVPTDEASPELRFNLACAYAVAGERTAMLRAVRSALMHGSSPAAFLRDADFDRYRDDTELRDLLERATPPEISVDVRPHMIIVRAAIDTVLETLREYGETVKLEPPASLDTILASERAGKVQLPNDYRALLTISDGMTLWDHQFFGTIDYRTDTLLAKRARDYLEMSARYGARGIEDCVPLANWGQPNDWLLYDPFGRYRGGEPGIVLILDTEEHTVDGVAAALEQFDEVARDVLGTN